MGRRTLPGTPITKLRGGTSMPSGTSVPAAMTHSSPTCASFRIVAPIPMRHKEPIRQPCNVTEWPTVTWSATTVGCCSLKTWTTQLSWMLLYGPMRMEWTSPRMTAFIHTLAWSPSSTSPMTWAETSTNTRSPSLGQMPL